jgi:hypothetical protein
LTKLEGNLITTRTSHNPQNLKRGAKYKVKGDTDETIAARVTVQLSAAEWKTIKQVVNRVT